jgi:tRNA (guanosine-2'-O-)-methyltransferase
MRDRPAPGDAPGVEPSQAGAASPPAEAAGAPRRLARAEAVLAARRRALTVVLEDAHDPHNVSAVLRTCEALGIQDVHLVAEQQSDSILNPKVSIGAHRWLTLHRHAGSELAIAALRAAGYRLFVSHLDARATPLPELPAETRAAYVFGNERSGVTRRWLEAADATFIIPTSGFSGSLNLSVAVALTVYDRLLGRAGARLPAGDLAADEKTALRAQWYELLAHDNPERRREYEAYLDRTVPPQHAFGVDRRQRQPDAGSSPGEPA